MGGEINVEFDYFYAKQTQFPGGTNEHKAFFTRGLWKWSTPSDSKKTEPIKPDFKIPDRIRSL